MNNRESITKLVAEELSSSSESSESVALSHWPIMLWTSALASSKPSGSLSFAAYMLAQCDAPKKITIDVTDIFWQSYRLPSTMITTSPTSSVVSRRPRACQGSILPWKWIMLLVDMFTPPYLTFVAAIARLSSFVYCQDWSITIFYYYYFIAP